jgi:hypothetical protein
MTSRVQTEASPRKPQSRAVQSIENARKRPYKRVPSALTVEQRAEAVNSLRAGRNVHQVACEFSCAPWVVMELWVRAETRELRRAA